jgi:hypothetical protein
VTAYRERPPGALDLAPPAPDAPWYEHLAHQVVLAHQPAQALPALPALPGESHRGPTPAQVVAAFAKHYRPQCWRCGRTVERLALFPSSLRRTVVIIAFCHGKEAEFEIDELGVVVRAGDRDALTSWLAEQLRRKVFAP